MVKGLRRASRATARLLVLLENEALESFGFAATNELEFRWIDRFQLDHLLFGWIARVRTKNVRRLLNHLIRVEHLLQLLVDKLSVEGQHEILLRLQLINSV
mgnify:CR=1 FL=1